MIYITNSLKKRIFDILMIKKKMKLIITLYRKVKL